jgi:hypothetical protein
MRWFPRALRSTIELTKRHHLREKSAQEQPQPMVHSLVFLNPSEKLSSGTDPRVKQTKGYTPLPIAEIKEKLP